MRRLPVLQDATTDDALAASRPRWHWTLIGAGLAATLWAPLTVMATPIGQRLFERFAGAPLIRAAFLAAAAPALVAFAAAAGTAGALVGRFGGAAGNREAALGPVVAAAALSAFTVLAGNGFTWMHAAAAFAALGAEGAAFGALGARLGLRKRPVLDSAPR